MSDKVRIVSLDGCQTELTERDVERMLIERAKDIAGNEGMRWHLSKVRRGLFDITNCVYEGRQRALNTSGYIPEFFPQAWALRDQLLDLLGDYCMQREHMQREEWEAGWDSIILPQIEALV